MAGLGSKGKFLITGIEAFSNRTEVGTLFSKK